jgi:predicted PurR-regulated permease PerM
VDGVAGLRAAGSRSLALWATWTAARMTTDSAAPAEPDERGSAPRGAAAVPVSAQASGTQGIAPHAGPLPGSPVPDTRDPASTDPASTDPASPDPASTLPHSELDAGRQSGGHDGDVPRWLRASAGWAWRLLLIAALLYVGGRVASKLYVVLVPFAAAILLTALLQPLTARLRRAGLGTLSATWCTLLLAFAVIGGAVWLVTARVQAEYPTLLVQVRHTSNQIQHWLAGAPFHVRTGNLAKLSDNFVNYLSTHRSTLEGAALTGGRIVVELLAGIVLCFFISFFLIKDGERIWSWLVSGFSANRRRRANVAGRAAWQAVVYYVRGTIAVAAIHSLVMGVTLTVIGSPLVAPLALFMFVAAFVPLAGVLIAGTVAILIVLAAKGLVTALIVLGVMVVMNQLEGHLLQPQVVGKMVRLHPLAVILVLAVAGVVAGIAGAVVAVPITAALTSASRALRHDSAGDADDAGQAATRAVTQGDGQALTQGDGQALTQGDGQALTQGDGQVGGQGATDTSSTGVA